jgi:hypothetical protein
MSKLARRIDEILFPISGLKTGDSTFRNLRGFHLRGCGAYAPPLHARISTSEEHTIDREQTELDCSKPILISKGSAARFAAAIERNTSLPYHSP